MAIILSVKISHPILECDIGFAFSTVKKEFNSKTPCSAQLFKQPKFFGCLIFKSSSVSFRMFKREGGSFILFETEKASPSAGFCYGMGVVLLILAYF